MRFVLVYGAYLGLWKQPHPPCFKIKRTWMLLIGQVPGYTAPHYAAPGPILPEVDTSISTPFSERRRGVAQSKHV